MDCVIAHDRPIVYCLAIEDTAEINTWAYRVAVAWRGDDDHAGSRSAATQDPSVDYEHRCAEHEHEYDEAPPKGVARQNAPLRRR